MLICALWLLSLWCDSVQLNWCCRHDVSTGLHLFSCSEESLTPSPEWEGELCSLPLSMFYRIITSCEREEKIFLWFWSALTSQKYAHEILQMKSFCLHILSFSQKCHCCGEASFITLLKCQVLISGLIWRLFQTWVLWEKEMKVGSRVLCFWAPGYHSGKCFYAANG